ncbi:T9SS type A sorting domain-containing protein [bacterium]|nr:T9SS type A sorting domain-containing protein [bacterium]
MRKHSLFTIALLFLLLPLAATAQETFLFEADHLDMTVSEPGFYQFHGSLTNASAEEDVFIITRLSVEGPEDWTNSICTHEACYPPFLDEVEDPLTPGETDDVFSLDVQTTQEIEEGTEYVITVRFASTNVPEDTLIQVFTLTYSTNSVDDPSAQPFEYSLDPVYPNPFNAMSRVNFTLPQASKVQLVVMSVDGRIVQTLADGILPAGNHQRVFRSSPQMASGTYLVTLRAADKHFVQRAVLLK